MEHLGFNDYPDLHAWSTTHRARFWKEMIAQLGIVFVREPTGVLAGSAKNPRWLPGAAMSCVDSCFTADPGLPAILSGREGSKEIETQTYGELERRVNRVANGLVEHGFRPGDRIALYMPMTAECVVAYLGGTELGERIARELNPLFRIHELRIESELPRTASNKLMRRSLRDR